MSFVQVGSWNIEHLSGHSRADRRQSAYALADHIEMSGIDLLVLQEVYVTSDDEEVRISIGGPIIPRAAADGERRNSDLDIVCHLLEEHLDSKWEYRLLENRSPGDKSQLCGVLWNKDRLTLTKVTPLDVTHTDGNDSLWDRKPHVMNFSSQIDIYPDS